MSKQFWISLAVWGGCWGVLFLILELLAVADVVPWNTLSWTVWQIESVWGLFALVVIGGMFVLTLHFAFQGWPRNKFQRQRTEGKR